MIRLATFNVENLFKRPHAMNLPDWHTGQPFLDAVAELNRLFNQERYSPDDKARMAKLLADLGLADPRPSNEFVTLQHIRGTLFHHKGCDIEIVANGRSDWVGWAELKEETIRDQAIENTARVIAEVDADVIALIEIEDRAALQRFLDELVNPLLAKMNRRPYAQDMLLHGNDERAIDVAIASRFPIARMVTHAFDRSDGHATFSRDCPEYYLTLDDGRELVILPNHFASKGSDRTGARRRVQAAAVRKIYEAVRQHHELVAVCGDLNDHPAGGSLDELLTEPELTDAMKLPAYSGFPGTYQHATATEKLDYLLLSPALEERVRAVDVCRKGYYAPKKWQSFESINAQTKDRFQASDHHCLWADVDV